jgi:hypothetical protein
LAYLLDGHNLLKRLKSCEPLKRLVSLEQSGEPAVERCIGGSMRDDEAAIIRLWREERGSIEPEDLSGNLVVQLGLATKELNRRWYEANTGQVITGTQKRVRHPARWLVTNWSVHSASARELITDLFRRQRADPVLTRGEALRQGMMALLDGPGAVDGSGRTVYSYAHPMFWAPYSVIGDGGGT